MKILPILLMYLALAVLCIQLVYGVCTEPTSTENSYALTESKTSYDTNATYEVFCVPGYSLTAGSSKLTCLTSNSWDGEPPTCSPAEGTYPWWLLLILVVTVLILIPCVLPRIIFCLCCRKKDKEKSDRDDDEDDNEYDDDYPYNGKSHLNYTQSRRKGGGMEPMTNYGQNRMSNMDAMRMFNPEADKHQLARASYNTNY